jgi:two-component system, LytTR family, response regulator
MKRFRLLIVDDEPLIRAGIRDGLFGIEGVEIGGECGSVFEAVETICAGETDLVLLDVELPDGTGFDVIRQIGSERMPAVVFVTAYDKYAIQAFEVNAVDYLLKPSD